MYDNFDTKETLIFLFYKNITPNDKYQGQTANKHVQALMYISFAFWYMKTARWYNRAVTEKMSKGFVCIFVTC